MDLELGELERPVKVGVGCSSRGEIREKMTGPLDSIELHLFSEPEGLVNALLKREIDAAIRGTLPAGETLSHLRSTFRTRTIWRAALLEFADSSPALLFPVGLDEGWEPVDRVEAALMCARQARALGLGGKVAVLAGGREEDRGRSQEIDRSLHEAESVCYSLKTSGLDAELLGIQVERVGGDYGVVVAPDPISGNLIFRALHLVAGRAAYGAPVINLESVFVDTSRDRREYTSPVMLAAKLYSLGR